MKKFFKDNLPKPEDIRKYKALGVLGDSIFERELWTINKNNLSRAVAIGLFWGWMPMFFQMIPAAFCAVYFRANLPLSLAGVWISNPITMPPMIASSTDALILISFPTRSLIAFANLSDCPCVKLFALTTTAVISPLCSAIKIFS